MSEDASTYDQWGDPIDPAQAFQDDVQRAARRLRVQEAARAAVAAERAAGDAHEGYDVATLREVMDRPPEPPMRVERLIPSDSSTLVVAQRKTGKTTLNLNLARSLITGEPMLGELEVRPIAGNFAMLNFEVSPAMIGRWATEHGIDPDRFVLANMRGRRNPFANPDDRAALAQHLRNHDVEVVAVDPFGRAYTGTSQNDSGEVGQWLTGLDTFARTEVGARDVILSTHAGWNGERTRGSSALEDWADSIVTLTRDSNDETQRFIKAMGRMDDELEEDRLDFDPATRMLSLSGTGSRRQASANQKIQDLAVIVERVIHAKREVVGVGELQKLVKAEGDAPNLRSGEVAKAADHLEKVGLVAIVRGGPGKANTFRTVRKEGF